MPPTKVLTISEMPLLYHNEPTNFGNFALGKDASLTGGVESPKLALGMAEGPEYVKMCPCCGQQHRAG